MVQSWDLLGARSSQGTGVRRGEPERIREFSPERERDTSWGWGVGWGVGVSPSSDPCPPALLSSSK